MVEIVINSGNAEVDEMVFKNESGVEFIRKQGEKGKTTYKVEVSKLTAGIYFIEILYSNLHKEIAKFVKL